MECKHWTVLVIFNNCNIIIFTSKIAYNKYFDYIHKVVLDVISDNIPSIMHKDNYGAINTLDQNNTGYYVANFLSETMIL